MGKDGAALAKANKALADLNTTKTEIATQINEAKANFNGSPRKTFATLALLQADTDANTVEGKKYPYLVSADGHWYYWNGTAWTDGGLYLNTGGTYTKEEVYNKTETDGKINGINGDLSQFSGYKNYILTAGKYYNTSGTTVNIVTPLSNAGWKSVVIECSEGDSFIITGHSGSSPRLWCFVNASVSTTAATVLSVAIADRTETGTTITAPASATHLVCNFNVTYDASITKGETYPDGAGRLESLINDTKAIAEGVFTTYVSDLIGIIDAHVYRNDYEKYAIRYLWYNSPSHTAYEIYIGVYGYKDGAWTPVTNISRASTPANRTTVERLLSIDGTIEVVINWNLIPNPYTSSFSETTMPIFRNKCVDVVGKRVDDDIKGTQARIIGDGYAVKDTIVNRVIVDCNGNGDYTTLADAYNAITDSSHYNQYEIVVMPGIYNENNLYVPAYTHTHGIHPETTIITSEGQDTTLSLFDQRWWSSKLSNLTIISYTKYCVHYDYSLDGRTLVNENLHLIQKGSNSTIIGGGTFDKGATFIWNNCIFENGAVHSHTDGNQGNWDNSHDIFNGCKLVNAYYFAQSTGGFGHCVYEINGSQGKLGSPMLQLTSSKLRIADEPWSYLADVNEWQILGHNNKNMLVRFMSSGEGLVYTTANAGENISISGTAVNALFGYTKYKKGGTRLKGKAIGSLLVRDEQAGLDGTTQADRYQMWKRLGDCSVTNKTLSVTVGSTTQTYTFNQNYETSKTTEVTIMSDINTAITIASISKNVMTELWDGVNLEEKQFVVCSDSNDILKGCAVTLAGKVCAENASDVYGIALDDGVSGETVPVWVGNTMYYNCADGDVGVGSDGKLTASATTKIGTVATGILIRN